MMVILHTFTAHCALGVFDCCDGKNPPFPATIRFPMDWESAYPALGASKITCILPPLTEQNQPTQLLNAAYYMPFDPS
jgi:hypothetical protein